MLRNISIGLCRLFAKVVDPCVIAYEPIISDGNLHEINVGLMLVAELVSEHLCIN